MDDIQRWDFFGEVGINEPVRYLHLEAVKGRYVTYADHVAAIAAAQREAANQGYLNGVATSHAAAVARREEELNAEWAAAMDAATAQAHRNERKRSVTLIADSYKAGIKAARDAVDALYVPGWPPTNADVLAAIDALKGEA